MTVIEKVLLRKDIASIAVGVVVGFAAFGFVSSIASPIAGSILDAYQGTESSFKNTYLLPFFVFALQLVVLEGLLRLVILGREYSTNKAK